MEEKYILGDFIYDPDRHTLLNKSTTVKLTTKENALLKLLCLNMNQLLLRKKALIEIWGYADYFSARSMDVYISKLRKQFKEYDDVEIMNIRGRGYILINRAIMD